MEIKKLAELFQLLNSKPPKYLVIANGVDEHSLEAASNAVDKGIVKIILTGNKTDIVANCKNLGIVTTKFNIIDCASVEEATLQAVELARTGSANAIMKGLIGTEVFMKSILNKQSGLLTSGKLLTHITLIENRAYHKLLLVSDVAIIPLPNLDQKIEMTNALIEIAHQLGIDIPKVAFIAATEQVIEKMPACTDAFLLRKRWEDGVFPQSICAGPMALDLALDKHSAKIKNYNSPVAGDADCLLFPNIESGNVFYKTNTKLCNSETAAIVYGTSVPTVLSSRGDSMETKLYSIALAALIG